MLAGKRLRAAQKFRCRRNSLSNAAFRRQRRPSRTAILVSPAWRSRWRPSQPRRRIGLHARPPGSFLDMGLVPATAAHDDGVRGGRHPGPLPPPGVGWPGSSRPAIDRPGTRANSRTWTIQLELERYDTASRRANGAFQPRWVCQYPVGSESGVQVYRRRTGGPGISGWPPGVGPRPGDSDSRSLWARGTVTF